MKKIHGFLIFALLALDVSQIHNLWKISGLLELHVFDVGQGDSLLLVTPEEHHILIDGGPGDAVLEQLARVLPHEEKEIDLMILTHPHLDHMEGLIRVLDRFKVNAVLASLPSYPGPAYKAFLTRLEALGIPYYLAQANQDFQFAGTHLDVLYPFEPILGQEFENVNNASPVIRVSHGEFSLMLSGDAEQEVEAELLDRYPKETLEADFLKAGHHGSKTSNTLAFLQAVSPKVMAISCGDGNSYGHPSPETLEKAADLGITVRRTDLEGTLHFSWR